MTTLWTDFAKFGNPSPRAYFAPFINWSTPLTQFTPYNQFLNISDPNPKMDSNQEIQNRMEFWDNLI